MKISIISFTENGAKLSEMISEKLGEQETELFTKCTYFSGIGENVRKIDVPVVCWAGEQMAKGNGLIFIGACGIAVRAIAPHIVSKLSDSPVIVIDEKGDYVIPILSGHIGGANELACRIAECIGAVPVITTATDIRKKFAVDLFAKKNGLFIENKEGIAKISAKVLAGEKIRLSVEAGHMDTEEGLPDDFYRISYPPNEKADILIISGNRQFEAELTLRPKEYIIGAGCKRGKDPEMFSAFIRNNLVKAGIREDQIYALASIDVKENEPAMVEWSQKRKIPFLTYSSEELLSAEGDFSESDFVKSQVGVGNVCERSAMKAAGPGGELIFKKYAEDGMTIGIAKRRWRVRFDET